MPISSRRYRDYPSRFFVGFGAGPEEQFFKRYSEAHHNGVGRLDQTEVRSLASWHRVDVAPALRSLAHALGTAREAVASLPSDLSARRTDFLTYVGMRVGYFAYARTWFESLKVGMGVRLEEVAFLAADVAAFAAVDVHIPTCYLQHGMIAHLLLPAFTQVEALSADEVSYLRQRLPAAQIRRRPLPTPTLRPPQLARVILVASIYGSAEYMSLAMPFLWWANAAGVPIHVRPHPREDRQFWNSLASTSIIALDDRDVDIFEAMRRLRPRLMVSWYSTALVDALEFGVIPVTVCTDDDPNVSNMVYPLFKRCIRWPGDSDAISRLLDDDELYESVLSGLRKD